MPPRLIWPVLMALGVLVVGPVLGQETSGNPFFTKNAVFRIPFQAESGQGRLKQIDLYVSTDQGKTWHPAGTVAPEQRFFDFRAKEDGSYWFAVRTVETDGRAFPLTMENARPGLKVVVDTRSPVVRLRGLPARGSEVGVEWEVRDDNLDPLGMRLEYRLPGAVDWLPVSSDLPASGQRYWNPATNGSLEVRLRAQDRAGNSGEDKTTLTPGAPGGPLAAERPAEPSTPRPGEALVKLVNSKRIALNYEIKDKGPSGVSLVELWYTKDPAGRTWQRVSEQDGNKPPPIVFDVHGEGLYGFSLVVKSGVGLGDRPPQVGDQPQVWVEVDLTKPVVIVKGTTVGRGADSGRLTIEWSATDKNFGRQPIALTYAEQATGPWKPIAANLENTGRYTWQMPAEVPYRFLVRVEAADKAGNMGSTVTMDPVIVDLSQPKGIILNVEPADK